MNSGGIGSGGVGGEIEGGTGQVAVARDAAAQEDADEGGGEEPTIDDLREELELAEERIADLERLLARESERHALERLLEDAGAKDPETALVLSERLLTGGGLTPAEAVARLVQTKAYLFRSASAARGAEPGGRGAGALSGEPARALDSLESLASEARETGDRRAVLRYLRRRRG